MDIGAGRHHHGAPIGSDVRLRRPVDRRDGRPDGTPAALPMRGAV